MAYPPSGQVMPILPKTWGNVGVILVVPFDPCCAPTRRALPPAPDPEEGHGGSETNV